MVLVIALLGLSLKPAVAIANAEHLFFGSILVAVRRNGPWRQVGSHNGPLASHTFQQIDLGCAVGTVKIDGLEYSPPDGAFATNRLEENVYFNGKATWPRPVRELSVKSPEYRRILGSFLRRHGIRTAPELSQVISVDLDGDGKQEVFLMGTMQRSTHGNDMDAGNYSVLLLRYLQGGKVREKAINFERTTREHRSVLLEETVRAIADLDGDGVMEFVVSRRMPDTHFASLMRFNRGKLQLIADAGYAL